MEQNVNFHGVWAQIEINLVALQNLDYGYYKQQYDSDLQITKAVRTDNHSYRIQRYDKNTYAILSEDNQSRNSHPSADVKISDGKVQIRVVGSCTEEIKTAKFEAMKAFGLIDQ